MDAQEAILAMVLLMTLTALSLRILKPLHHLLLALVSVVVLLKVLDYRPASTTTEALFLLTIHGALSAAFTILGLPWVYLMSGKNSSSSGSIGQGEKATSSTKSRASSKIGVGQALPHHDHHHCIYLDYNATSPIFPEVASEMTPFLSTCFGNPSSGHAYGKPCVYLCLLPFDLLCNA